MTMALGWVATKMANVCLFTIYNGATNVTLAEIEENKPFTSTTLEEKSVGRR